MEKDILEKAIDVAVKEAYLGIKNNHGGPFGTVIFKGNKIIAKAYNEVVKITTQHVMVKCKQFIKHAKNWKILIC